MPTDPWSAFDTYVAAERARWDVPGVAVAVLHGDDVVYRGAHGLRDVDAGAPLTPGTRFAMASVTKSVTAASVALLVDEGKLAWDEPVRTYLPELVLADPYATEHLNLRDMLSHRSGLPRHDLAAWRLEGATRADLVPRMRHLRFVTGFRGRWAYNNLMYYLAGHVVERVAGEPWEAFARRRLLEPLGMRDSGFDPDGAGSDAPLARGYRLDRDANGDVQGLIPTPFGAHTALSPSSAGALFSTLDDMTRWLALQLRGGAPLVGETVYRELHRPQVAVPVAGPKAALLGHGLASYGFGWTIEPFAGHTLVQHGGNVEGHSLMVGFVPEARVGAVVLANAALTALRDALLYEALDRALGAPARDWSGRFFATFDPLARAGARGQHDDATPEAAGAPASHPLSAYAGSFRHPGYPPVEVREVGGDLEARLVGSVRWSALAHLQHDVFVWKVPDFAVNLRVRFVLDDHGDVDALDVPIEPEVDDARFRRAPVALPDDVADALVGTYATDVAGLALVVARVADGFTLSVAGGGPEKVEPVASSADAVILRGRRARLRCDLGADGSVARVVLRTPGLTLEGRR